MQAVVILRGEIEDAGSADEALQSLQRVAGLLPIRACLLDDLAQHGERIVGVAAEGADVLLELGLVVLLVLHEQGLLRMTGGQALGDDKAAGGKDDALGGRAGGLDVLDIAEAVALVDGDIQANLAGVLQHDGLGRLDRPVDECLHARGLELGGHRRQIRRLLVVDLVGHDLDPHLLGHLLDLLLARLAEASVGGHESDLGEAGLLDVIEDLARGVGIVLRRLEHPLAHRFHDGLGRRAREQQGLALLGKALDLERLATGRGADDGEDLVLLDELLGQRDGLFGAAARVLEQDFDGMAGEPSLLVGFIGEHLQRARLGAAQVGGRARDAEDGPNLDGFLGNGRAGEEERSQEHDPLRQSIHGISPRGGWLG